jgi:dCMP deaminase
MPVTRFINELGYDNLGRPCKDLYFMNMAFASNKRSLDPSTKCGSVAVYPSGGLITTGYNSPVSGAIEENIPLTRPEKYYYFEHSERNLIYIAAKEGKCLNESTFYITGLPCIDCMRGLLQVGCSRCVYGPLQANMCLDKEYIARYDILFSGQSMILEKFKYKESLLEMSPEIAEQIIDRPDINIQYNV